MLHLERNHLCPNLQPKNSTEFARHSSAPFDEYLVRSPGLLSWSEGSHLESVPNMRLLGVRQKSKLAQLTEETGVGATAICQVRWDADRYVSMSLTERLTFATAVEAVLRSLNQYGRSAGVLLSLPCRCSQGLTQRSRVAAALDASHRRTACRAARVLPALQALAPLECSYRVLHKANALLRATEGRTACTLPRRPLLLRLAGSTWWLRRMRLSWCPLLLRQPYQPRHRLMLDPRHRQGPSASYFSTRRRRVRPPC